MTDKAKLLASALSRLDTIHRQESFDPLRPGSTPTPAQQEIMDDFGKIPIQWVVASNRSGKSALAARLLSWFITETHPRIKRITKWGNAPLLAIVAARTGKQIEDSLVPKIISCLETDTYKIIRIGNITQRIELSNGNKIVFQSLENPNMARERLQGYTAHMVWLDEMPPSVSIVSELLMRVQADSGFFIATFTPLSHNPEIKRLVESSEEPHAKRYSLFVLDNPLFGTEEEKNRLISSMAGLSDDERNARLYGRWISPDSLVYHFSEADMVRELPSHYSLTGWRHVEAVDPALSATSALGLTVWAEDPTTGVWYCVLSEYIRGIAIPSHMVEAVRSRVRNYHVVRRICDPEANWYIGAASEVGLNYIGLNKRNRKIELIKQLQSQLASGKIYLTPNCVDLMSELRECRWAPGEGGETGGRIINSSSYHLLDTAQYAVDNLPRFEGPRPLNYTSENWQGWIRQENQKWEEEEHRKKMRVVRRAIRRHKLRAKGNQLWNYK